MATGLAGRRLFVPLTWPTGLWLVVFLAVGGLLVNGSAPLDRGDPRYQIGFRAVLIATTDGYAGVPHWQDPTVLHINPTYPLHLSGTEAVTLRLTGCGPGASAVRAVGCVYFVALLLLARVAGGRPSAWPVAVVAAVPQVWLRGPAEIYADLPLGVTLLAALLWLERAGGIVAALLGAALVGMKAEGVAAVGALAVGLVAATSERRVAAVRLTSFLVGGAAGFALTKLGLSQMGDLPPMENVSLSEVTPGRVLAGLDRLPTIGAAFAHDLTRPAAFGLYFPLAVGCLFWVRTTTGVAGAVTAGLYLVALAVPFLVTRIPLVEHLEVCVTRFGCQLLPLLLPAVAASLARLQAGHANRNVEVASTGQ